MNIKITQMSLPGGLGGSRLQSKIVQVPDGEELPEGATPTDEPERDWQIEESST